MLCFELLREHFAMCGIAISPNSPKTHPFNGKNSAIVILLCVNVSSIAILLNEANTFEEITDIVFRSVSTSTCGILYVAIVWKTSALDEFIDRLADTVDASESSRLYYVDFDSISKSNMFLHHLLHVCTRTEEFKVEISVRPNESKNGKMDYNSTLCVCKSHANS